MDKKENKPMDRIEKTIILITILAQILIVVIAMCFTGCQTPYTDYGFGVGDLDRLAGANECITDGFDWICRGPVEYITVEKVRTVKEVRTVEVEIVRVETADPIEIVIREIYLVKIEPNMVVETPVGIIETDSDGNIVAPPEDVNIIPYEPPTQNVEMEEVLPKPQPQIEETEEVVHKPQPRNEETDETAKKPIPQNTEMEDTEPKPTPQNTEMEETEPKPIPQNAEMEDTGQNDVRDEVVPKPQPQPPSPQKGDILAYLHQNTQGFWLVGFIHTDYVLLEGNQLTYLGANKVRDADDETITIREHRFVANADDPHIVAGELFATLIP